MSTYGKLLVPDHALYPVHIFVDTYIDVGYCAATQRWPKTIKTYYIKCSGFCSPHLQGCTRINLKIREKNVTTLTVAAQFFCMIKHC